MSLDLLIADQLLRIELSSAFPSSLLEQFAARAGDFVVDAANVRPRACMKVSFIGPGEEPELDRGAKKRPACSDYELWIPADRTRAFVRADPTEALATGLDHRALRALVSEMLPRDDGFLIHAAAAAGFHGAVLFAGPSGAGKSTVAARVPRDALLGDDTVALRRDASGWLVCSTPFVNTGAPLPARRRAPLDRVFVLERADTDAVVALGPGRRGPALLSNVLQGPIPFWDVLRVVELLDRLVKEVPVARCRRTLEGELPMVLHAAAAPRDAIGLPTSSWL
jgi:hypothetical protein